MDIKALFEFASNHKASDIHISVGNPPVTRINGELMPLRVTPLTKEDVEGIIDIIASEHHKEHFKKFNEVDFAYQNSDKSRYRVNLYQTQNGPSIALREIAGKAKTIEELHAPEILYHLATLEKGLVLVTGATGSGKSTTMNALLDYVNNNFSKHILTIEDPIEFIHKSKKSLINQREIGVHSHSFNNALKSALREDPDIILVGELRDLDTIKLALTAAETGHLVISTLHTNNASQTINRIIDVFPGNEKNVVRSALSSSLEAVISQRLLKLADNSGRIAAYEVMIATPAVRNLIREDRIPQLRSIIQTGQKKGMIFMDDCVNKYLEKNLITEETAKQVLIRADSDEKNQNISDSGF